MPEPDDGALFLYTSNIREQYIDDALRVLAQEKDTYLRFRYDERHFDDAIRAAWAKGLRGRQALIHLSIQHAERFHESAYVPLRRAEVVDTQTHGTIRIIDLKLGDYFSLPGIPSGQADRSKLGERVVKYSQLIRERPICNPDEKVSAGVGPTIAEFTALVQSKLDEPLVTAADDAFTALVQYMNATLTNPGRFYYRVAGMRRVGANKDVGIKDGEYKLRTGDSYRLTVVQYQVTPAMLPAELLVTAGDGLDLHSVNRLELRSTYDTYAVAADVEQTPSVRRSYVDLRPATDHGAPEVRLPLRLVPPRSQQVAMPAIAGVATGIIALAATDTFPKGGGGVLLSVGAAVALFVVGWLQSKRGLKLF